MEGRSATGNALGGVGNIVQGAFYTNNFIVLVELFLGTVQTQRSLCGGGESFI